MSVFSASSMSGSAGAFAAPAIAQNAGSAAADAVFKNARLFMCFPFQFFRYGECSTWNIRAFLATGYIFLANAKASMFLNPSFFKTLAHSDIVAPLVITSSTITMCAPFGIFDTFLLFALNAPFMFSSLSSFVRCVCVSVLFVLLRAFDIVIPEFGNARIAAFAIISLWLYPASSFAQSATAPESERNLLGILRASGFPSLSLPYPTRGAGSFCILIRGQAPLRGR